jgi:hypothetical protein
VRLEGLGQLKKSDDTGTRTRDLPACSIVPQPTMLPHAPNQNIYISINLFFLICILGGGIKVHSTLRPLNGLLCQPQVIMIMEKSVE